MKTYKLEIASPLLKGPYIESGKAQKGLTDKFRDQTKDGIISQLKFKYMEVDHFRSWNITRGRDQR